MRKESISRFHAVSTSVRSIREGDQDSSAGIEVDEAGLGKRDVELRAKERDAEFQQKRKLRKKRINKMSRKWEVNMEARRLGQKATPRRSSWFEAGFLNTGSLRTICVEADEDDVAPTFCGGLCCF